MRLGLAAGAASLGAVALSLLIGGTSATAADDIGGNPTVDPSGAVALVAEPVDTLVVELTPATAPVEAIVEPAVAPVVAPVVHAVVELPGALVESVRSVTAPVTDAVQPVLEPLAPLTRPVGELVDIVRDEALGPVVGIVDRTVAELPVVGGLLGEQPVTGILDPVGGIVAQTVEGTIQPSPEPIGTILETDAGEAPTIIPALESAAAFDALAVVVAEPAPPGSFASAGAEPVVLVVPVEPVVPLGAVPLAVVPAGASGAAGASAGPQASIMSSHRLPQLAAGATLAVESDRIPDAPVEEHTASPD